MWLLENDAAFQNRRLWLRPGKTYLFGRTAAEPGQLIISHNTISRKHLTIAVDSVPNGDAHNLASRSRVTIEDLATKIGTFVNGNKIKGQKHQVEDVETEVMMGKCPDKFRLVWFPVVLTFSLASKDHQTQTLDSLRQRFEELDIKLLAEYSVGYTTHVVSKKRNTSKGLQALINCGYIVGESFLDAIEAAAKTLDDDSTLCALDGDFGQFWPNALEHLPPRGGEPVQHSDDIYAPNSSRKDVFDGYTFVFYDKTQYNNLLAPITNGCGKALLRNITPGEEQVDDFVRHIKQVAGESGLGRFDDGSEGKGVVLVRYLPAKGDLIGWYTTFITQVSLLLDHRPIEQNEFLEAILTVDAGILRRPLEPESPDAPDQYAARNSVPPSSQPDHGQQEQLTAPRRGRARQPIKRRFAGFDDGEDVEIASPPPDQGPRAATQLQDEGGLFVSQEPEPEPEQEARLRPTTIKSPCKRPAPDDGLLDDIAPAVARFKRQRLERADIFESPPPNAESPPKNPASELSEAKLKKPEKEIDVLAMAARNREQQDANTRAEKEELEKLPDDLDLAAIRRLHIVEEMAVGGRARENQYSRWDARWNGMRNYKRFCRRGETAGRLAPRHIVPLKPAEEKSFGVGDSYWLEEGGASGTADVGQDQGRDAERDASGDESLLDEDPFTIRCESPQQRRGPSVEVAAADEEASPRNQAATRRPQTRSSNTANSRQQAKSQTRAEKSPEPTMGPPRLARTAKSQSTHSQVSCASSKQPGRKHLLSSDDESPPLQRKRARKASSQASGDEMGFNFGRR
ncbi:hypothetical protein CDD81_7849 [Ophiocordyceps australis]|uniref:FHA domain-containing protein n=1 Tax=Ophiocordyceps australis TaxID=1399860 RepID=A0A2C5YEX2_9HYPO|nr:hypothetical protein CDD81_7849 [Ophiocordyceps australis]